MKFEKVSEGRWNPEHNNDWSFIVIAFVSICIAVVVVL